jgi:tRNA 2-thiouridine synthesizing protein A
MGFLDSVFCADCLARGLQQERMKFLESALEFVERLECWGAGWRWASEHEGLDESLRPACLWRDGAAGAPVPGEAPPEPATARVPVADVSWDAGDISCGELLMKLRGKLKALEPGTVIRVHARDSASPEDIPAWCSLTGHALLAHEHPDYWIRRRD